MDFNLKAFMDGPGTWREQSILFAMIIYSIFLVIMSMIWFYRYYRGTKKPGKIRLIFIYLFSFWIIGNIGQLIENILYSKELNTYIGLHLFWGEKKDIWITIIAPLVPPILCSLIFAAFLKYKKKNNKII